MLSGGILHSLLKRAAWSRAPIPSWLGDIQMIYRYQELYSESVLKLSIKPTAPWWIFALPFWIALLSTAFVPKTASTPMKRVSAYLSVILQSLPLILYRRESLTKQGLFIP